MTTIQILGLGLICLPTMAVFTKLLAEEIGWRSVLWFWLYPFVTVACVFGGSWLAFGAGW